MFSITTAVLLLAGVTITKSQVVTPVKCADDELGKYFASTTDCSVYYLCAGSSSPYYWYIGSCPPGLHFNDETSTCDIPSKITHTCGCNEQP
ncbi:chitin binding peritrophin-A domain-containing protein [Pedobacter sp. HDW13]|uniref:chitin binding peritrophin-A domain-containing protein n=1 Tax=unclassified Pedobacter TaxID=2628915 RepID=UPI00351AFDA0